MLPEPGDGAGQVLTSRTTSARDIAAGCIAASTRLSDLASVLAVVCLTLLLLLVIAGIAAGMLAKSFPAAAGAMSVSWEYEGYLMGAAFMLAMPRALRQGIHIRVTLISDFCGPQLKRVLDLVATAVSLVVVTVMAVALVRMSADSFETGNLSTGSLTPLWIPEGIFALSTVLFGLQLVARIVAILVGLPVEEQKEFVGAPVE